MLDIHTHGPSGLIDRWAAALVEWIGQNSAVINGDINS